MHLEELATELNVSTAHLTAVAADLGWVHLTPTTPLTLEETTAIRTRHAASAAAAPAPPPTGSAPASRFGPLTPNPYTSTLYPSSAPSPSRAVPPKKARVGLLLAVAGVAAVIGAAVFVVSSDDEPGGSDAATETKAPELVDPTGPDGEPLTQAEREGLARMKLVDEEKKAKACAALKPISELDQSDGPISGSIDTFEEAKQAAIAEMQRGSDLYEPVIAALPEQAEGIRRLQATYQALADAFAGASSADEIDEALDAVGDQFASSGARKAVNNLDAYAQENCDFSINQN